MLGVVGEEDDLTMDYVREEEDEEEEEEEMGTKHNSPTGYNFRPSDRLRNEISKQ